MPLLHTLLVVLVGAFMVSACDDGGTAPTGGFQWRGAWSSTAAYAPGDVVRADPQHVYIATRESSNVAPSADAPEWDLFVQGAAGVAGPSGQAGPVGPAGPAGPEGPMGQPGMSQVSECPDGMVRVDSRTCIDAARNTPAAETPAGALLACIAEGQRLCTFEEMVLANHCFESPQEDGARYPGCLDPFEPLVIGRLFEGIGCEPILQPPGLSPTGSGAINLGPWSATDDGWRIGFDSEECGTFRGYRCCVDL